MEIPKHDSKRTDHHDGLPDPRDGRMRGHRVQRPSNTRKKGFVPPVNHFIWVITSS